MGDFDAVAVAKPVAMVDDAEQHVFSSDNMDTDRGDVVTHGSGGEDTTHHVNGPSNCGGNGLRRAHLDLDFCRMHTLCAPSRRLFIPLCSFLVAGAEVPESKPAELSTERLTATVEEVCVGGTGRPETGRNGAIVQAASNALVWNIMVAIHQLYSARRSAVRWVTSTSQLDQEEALAYVLAQLLCYELLPEEARSIGNLARKAALAYKGRPPGAKGAKLKPPPVDQALKDQASKDKYAAKAAAAKDAELTAGIEQRLADIDAVLAAKRSRLDRTEVELQWPARNTVIADGPAPVHWRAREADSDDELRPQTAAEAAEAAAEAEADAQAAEAVANALALKAERASKSLMRLPGSDRDEMAWVNFLVGAGEKKLPLTAVEMQRRDAAFERCSAARHKLVLAVGEAEQAEKEAQRARCLADTSAKLACVMRSKEAAEQLEMVNQRIASLELKHAKTQAELEAAEAADRALVCGKVLMDAQKVWGSMQGTVASAAPKVFKLTGDISAQGFAALSAEVSQVVTGAEERAALARSGPVQPVAGVAVGSPLAMGASGVVAGVLV